MTTYIAEYGLITEDDEKEMLLIQQEQFPTILSMVKWARQLPPKAYIRRKLKLITEDFDRLDNGEFDVQFSLKP